IDGILAILPFQMLPSEADVRISLPVLGVTVCSSILAGLLFGCAPAMQASRVDLSEALKQGVRFGTWIGGRSFRRILVVVEFAIALTLLASGGLALRSFWNLTSVDLGVQTDHVLTFNLPVPQARFDKPEKIAPYFRQLLERVEQVPGVESVAVTTGIPLRGSGSNRGFRIAGRPIDPDARQAAGFQMVTSGYFDAFKIRLINGRQFNDQDTESTLKVAMINEAFADRFFSDGNPIGQRIVTRQQAQGSSQPGAEVEWTVVGIFHNTRNGDQLRGGDYPVIYVPFWQNPSPRASMAVRTTNKPERLTNSLATTINTFDPDLPLAGVKTLDQILNESLSFDRFGAVLYGTFAALALLLAAIGIYGVMSFGVAQRTREFGIRMALGAGAGRIRRSVLEEGLALALAGLTLGLGCTYFVGRAMQSMLYGVGAFDVVAFGGVAIILLVTAALACYIPARRASRVDPMISLRAE
ncbi:MAG TPA: FtsX-like permease family protein, partial [Blastocatellia bacterium]|nr:FtsX-like permease family protein [Blastocatellia bacterium]